MVNYANNQLIIINMKNFLLSVLALILITACQQPKQRYFFDSPEIQTLKAGIKAYEDQDWTSWKANFADTAKIHHNTVKGISVDENLKNLQGMISNFSDYGFEDKGAFTEMVIDKDEETWVNYWGIWKGHLSENNKEIVIPVHLTAQFIDGKIVQEYVYYDSSKLVAELQSIANEKADMSMMESEE